MFSDNGKISSRQMGILIIASNIGIGTILLPKIFFGYSPVNLIWVLVIILLAVILIKESMCGSRNFFEITNKILGIECTKILSLALGAKIILTSGIQAKLFSHIIKTYILPNTNQFVITLMMMLAVWYLNLKGYESRGRLCEILIWLMTLPLAIVFFITLMNIKTIELPNLEIDLGLAFKSIFIFSQLDYLFLTGWMAKTREKITDAILITWLGIIFLVEAISMKIKFATPIPIIKLMSVTDIPGGFVQNQDFFIITFVIISFFTLISGGAYFSSKIFNNLWPGLPKHYSKLISTLLIAAASLLASDIFYLKSIYFLGTVFYFVLPLLVNIINFICKKDVCNVKR